MFYFASVESKWQLDKLLVWEFCCSRQTNCRCLAKKRNKLSIICLLHAWFEIIIYFIKTTFFLYFFCFFSFVFHLNLTFCDTNKRERIIFFFLKLLHKYIYNIFTHHNMTNLVIISLYLHEWMKCLYDVLSSMFFLFLSFRFVLFSYFFFAFFFY